LGGSALGTVSVGPCTDGDPSHPGKLDTSQQWTMAKMRHKEGDGDGAFKMRQEGDGDGAFKLQNVGSGLCLDPTGTTKPPSLASCTVPGISWTYLQVIRDAPLRFSISPSLLSLNFSPSLLSPLSLSPFPLFFSFSPSLLPWLLFFSLSSPSASPLLPLFSLGFSLVLWPVSVSGSTTVPSASVEGPAMPCMPRHGWTWCDRFVGLQACWRCQGGG
jgi:hypothetical protein